MKIVYCIDATYNLSGTDIVTITKANALAAIPGNHVWIVTANNPRSLLHRLKQVSMTDLGIRYYEHDDEGLLAALIDLYRVRKRHKKKLEEFLENVQPDVVISSGVLTKGFLPQLKLSCNPVFIRELHADRHYNLDSAKGFIRKLIAKVGEFVDYRWKINAYDKVVVPTEKERSGSWKNWKKLEVIPNPITNWSGLKSDGTAKVVISAGRLMKMKNFDGLINIWAKVIERHPDWVLQIWGAGELQASLQNHIDELGIAENVQMMGYTTEIGEKMSQASIMALASLSESFSLVTLEAMSVGIPTVVYNCPGGISYVVKDGETGYLVPLNDEEAFVERFCQLIENPELRKTMGEAGIRKSQQFTMESVIPRWIKLFQELVEQKRGKGLASDE